MADDFEDLIHDVVAAPLGDVIASVGEGVAEAQAALDAGSIAKTLEIYGAGGETALQVLRDIGYRPTFYALPETTGEVRVSLTLGNAARSPAAASRPAPTTPGGRFSRIVGSRQLAVRPYASPVSAGFASRYAYSAELSARLSFKIVPVPAPDGADELRVMPSLIGKTVAEAVTILDALGLDAEFRDAGGTVVTAPEDADTVTAQARPADEIVRTGDVVALTVAAAAPA